MSKYRITLVESEEGFAVWCDDLPGCCSQGRTHAEAVKNIRRAIQDYLAARANVAEYTNAKVTRERVTV